MKRILLSAALLFLSGQAQASILLDTGVIDTNFANQVDFVDRNFYGRFIIDDYYRLTDAESFFIRDPETNNGDQPTTLYLSLYKGDVISAPDSPSPNVRRPDFSNRIAQSALTFEGNQAFKGYKGINDIDLYVTPGVYWVGLEGDEHGPATGKAWAVGAVGAVDPLDEYHNKVGTGLFNNDQNTAKKFAFRAQGYAVPEPASVLLLGGGFAGLLLRKRRSSRI